MLVCVIALAIASLPACSRTQTKEEVPPPPESASEDFEPIPQSMKAVLLDAETIETFRTYPYITDGSPTSPRVGAFPVRQVGPVLSGPRADSIRTLLLASEKFPKVPNLCGFCPSFAYRFCGRQDSLVALLAFKCGRVSLELGGTRVTTAIEPIVGSLRRISNEIFEADSLP